MTVDSDIARERYRSIQRLARASESIYSEQVVLKGGMLISAFTER